MVMRKEAITKMTSDIEQFFLNKDKRQGKLCKVSKSNLLVVTINLARYDGGNDMNTVIN